MNPNVFYFHLQKVICEIMRVSLLTEIAPENKLLSRIASEARNAKTAFIAVSFIQREGLKYFFESIKGMLNKGKQVTIYTSGYLRITEPNALEDLLKLTKSYNSLKVYFNPDDRFHSKFFLFEKPNKTYSLFLGSSNISLGGLAEIGELNVHISGKISDQIYRDLKIAIDNLRKNRRFKKIDRDVISQYKTQFRKQRKRERRGTGARPVYHKPSLPPLPTLPVYVVVDEFTSEEMRKIKEKHPRWKDYVDYMSSLNGLKKGDPFLLIRNIRGRPKMFNVAQFIEYDRIEGIGKIAHIEPYFKRDRPLKNLAKKLRLSEKKLLERKKLDNIEIAILRRNFKIDI